MSELIRNCPGWQILVALPLFLVGISGCKPTTLPVDQARIERRPDLELRILANKEDDSQGIDAAWLYFTTAQQNPKRKAELDELAVKGLPPPPVSPADPEEKWPFTYTWFEAAPALLRTLGLDPSQENDPTHEMARQEVARARQKGEPLFLPSWNLVLFSRPCQLRPNQGEDKAFDYFILTRDPAVDRQTGQSQAITGKHLVRVDESVDAQWKPSVLFQLSEEGGELFFELTSQNRPTGPQDNKFYRHIAVIVAGKIVTAPRLQSPIRRDGQITGNFTQEEVEEMVRYLRGDRQ